MLLHMSIEVDGRSDAVASSFPELTPLGKRIEMLRIERGLSKQQLARLAGTSRQQLWRVVSGKSDLTTSLCARLAEALDTDPRFLRAADERFGNMRLYTEVGLDDPSLRPALLHFFATRDASVAALGALPEAPVGPLLAGAMMRALEAAARAAGLLVPDEIARAFRDAGA